MKPRRQVLDRAAAGTELELAAAVGADAALGAVVIGLAQRAQAAQPGGLEVHHAGREGERLYVRHAVDRRVPGDAVPVGLEERVDLRRQRRVLDPGLREGR